MYTISKKNVTSPFGTKAHQIEAKESFWLFKGNKPFLFIKKGSLGAWLEEGSTLNAEPIETEDCWNSCFLIRANKTDHAVYDRSGTKVRNLPFYFI